MTSLKRSRILTCVGSAGVDEGRLRLRLTEGSATVSPALSSTQVLCRGDVIRSSLMAGTGGDRARCVTSEAERRTLIYRYMPSYIVGGKATAASLLAAEEAFEDAAHMARCRGRCMSRRGRAALRQARRVRSTSLGLSRFSSGAPVVLEASKPSGLARRD